VKVLLFIILCAIVVTVIVFGINNAPQKNVQEILVKDYQGIKLDDLTAFRENSIKGVQYVSEENYILRVGGLVERPYEMSYSTLQELEHTEKVVTLFCVEGWTAKMLWGGIPLVELIEKAGPMAEVDNVIFKSTDGYTTSLSLDYIKERNIILADRLNGIKLPPAQGFPFIVVAEDKWGYKWARWVEEIELSDDETYRGYWEILGYSSDGSLDKPMFERYDKPESSGGKELR